MDPTLRRLTRELQACCVDGVTLEINEADMQNLVAHVTGPDGTPYASGSFRVRCHFGEDWPAAPPRCWFETKIFHPNVSTKGEICVNTLKKDWSSQHTIAHIFTTIKCLLIFPNPESALNEEAGRLLLEQYDDFARTATLMTSVHAACANAVFSPAVRTEQQWDEDSENTANDTEASYSLSAPLQPARVNQRCTLVENSAKTMDFKAHAKGKPARKTLRRL